MKIHFQTCIALITWPSIQEANRSRFPTLVSSRSARPYAPFDSLAHSQPFRSGDPLFTPSRVLGYLRRSFGFIFLTFHLFFLNSRGDASSLSSARSDRTTPRTMVHSMDSIQQHSYEEVTLFVEGHTLPILAHANCATSTFPSDVYGTSFPRAPPYATPRRERQNATCQPRIHSYTAKKKMISFKTTCIID